MHLVYAPARKEDRKSNKDVKGHGWVAFRMVVRVLFQM